MAPVAAAIAGLVVPALLFVLIARGSGNERPSGVVISTHTPISRNPGGLHNGLRDTRQDH
ncbi:hypothetical protein ACFPJ1_07805 [Kribbella qitaiheensis]|uniref:hypothetical protein n=1 Tax=Kribbella qitaiheensis TaxID=1544730 RepID=UPI0036066D9C